jgi:hypothetical protein
MGETTFSKRPGFLEQAKDIGDTTENIWKYFKKTSPIAQISWVDSLKRKKAILQRFKRVSAIPIIAFEVDRGEERQRQSGIKDNELKYGSVNDQDFLSRF